MMSAVAASAVFTVRSAAISGGMFWCMNAMGSHINWPEYPGLGTEPTKQAAAARVRRAYEQCLRR
jgi:hypothetical protein